MRLVEGRLEKCPRSRLAAVPRLFPVLDAAAVET